MKPLSSYEELEIAYKPKAEAFDDYSDRWLKRAISLTMESIEHWHDNYWAMEEAKIYTEDCPLCRVYGDALIIDGCVHRMDCLGCPIQIATGVSTCNITPWGLVEYSLSNLKDDPQRRKAIHVYREAVFHEISYLVDLMFALLEALKELERNPS